MTNEGKLPETPPMLQYSDIQSMLDDLTPECAAEFRAYVQRPSVRLRKWLAIEWAAWRGWIGESWS